MKRNTATGSVVLILILVLSATAEALPRGKSGTTTRKDYCKAKYDDCVQDARKDCKVTVPIAYDSSICLLGAMNACDRSWGNKSTCNTEELTGGAGATGIVRPLNRAP